MKNGLKKFFPAKGGVVFGPLALMSLLALASMMQFGAAPKMAPAFFALEILAVGGLAYSMHWKPRDNVRSEA